MPKFTVQIVNRDFRANSEVDAPDIDSAHSEAIRGAMMIGTEEVCAGKPFFGAEILVEGHAGDAQRFMIAIGATPLQ